MNVMGTHRAVPGAMNRQIVSLAVFLMLSGCASADEVGEETGTDEIVNAEPVEASQSIPSLAEAVKRIREMVPLHEGYEGVLPNDLRCVVRFEAWDNDEDYMTLKLHHAQTPGQMGSYAQHWVELGKFDSQHPSPTILSWKDEGEKLSFRVKWYYRHGHETLTSDVELTKFDEEGAAYVKMTGLDGRPLECRNVKHF